MQNVTGLEQLLRNLDSASERYVDAASAAIYAQDIALLELVNRKEMVPVQTGELKASNYVTLPVRENGRVVCEVGYGAEHAPKVHERGGSRVFTRSDGSRSANGHKWLERAANIHANAMDVRLRENVSRNFALGVKAEQLAGAFPTSPQTMVGMGKFERKYGVSREQRAAMRKLAKAGVIKLVRRWKKKGARRGVDYRSRK